MGAGFFPPPGSTGSAAASRIRVADFDWLLMSPKALDWGDSFVALRSHCEGIKAVKESPQSRAFGAFISAQTAEQILPLTTERISQLHQNAD